MAICDHFAALVPYTFAAFSQSANKLSNPIPLDLSDSNTGSLQQYQQPYQYPPLIPSSLNPRLPWSWVSRTLSPRMTSPSLAGKTDASFSMADGIAGAL